MMRRPGTDFLGMANTLRSLTRSPATAAIQEAHRVARRRLEIGGAAVPDDCIDERAGDDFILPGDIDPAEIVKAVEGELRKRSVRLAGAPPVLKRRRGGPAAISGYHILRLGDGRFDRGRRFMHMVITQIRGSRCAANDQQ